MQKAFIEIGTSIDMSNVITLKDQLIKIHHQNNHTSYVKVVFNVNIKFSFYS